MVEHPPKVLASEEKATTTTTTTTCQFLYILVCDSSLTVNEIIFFDWLPFV